MRSLSPVRSITAERCNNRVEHDRCDGGVVEDVTPGSGPRFDVRVTLPLKQRGLAVITVKAVSGGMEL